MFCFKLTSLIVWLQAAGYAISLSTRGAVNNERPTLSLRDLQDCNDSETSIKVRFDYGDDPVPWVQYFIYHNNGTAIYPMTGEYIDVTNEKFYEKYYCLASKGCYSIAIPELGRWDYILGIFHSHYNVQVEWNGKKIADEKATHVQFYKFGNCDTHFCYHGEEMLHIHISDFALEDNPPESPSFNYSIYNGSGALIETQQEGYTSNFNASHHFETFLCLHPSDCYTVWIAKRAFYQVDYGKTLVRSGLSGTDKDVVKVGGGDCLVCNSKPLLVPSSSYQKAQLIMSVITEISGMEAFMDTDSPHYQAACWMIYEDAYQFIAADNSLVQRYILALLFFATNGWDWAMEYSFLSPISECDWYNYWEIWDVVDVTYYLQGVECNEKGNVVGINLKSNNLEGNLVSELSKLKDLEYLQLTHNHLRGTVPHEFGQIKQMKILHLGENTLTGTIPQGLLEIENLETLELSSNMLHGTLPSSSLSLPNLKSLWVSDNILHGALPDNIHNTMPLIELDLHTNLFSGTIPENIGKTALILLDLSNNNINGTIPRQLSELTNAENILLSNNSLSGTIPSELGLLSSLNVLDLSYNSLYGELPTSFVNLFSLEKIYIQNNYMNGHVSGDFCAHLNSVEGYSFEADCLDEQSEAMIICSCCTECYSYYSFLEHFGDCNGVEVKIQIIDEKSYELDQYWSLKDSLGRVILKDGPYLSNSPPISTYTSCVATTGCYNMHATGELEFEIFGNSASIKYHYKIISDIEVNFGYSSKNNSLEVDKCDDVKVYGEVATQNTTRREIFNSLERISGLHLLKSGKTPQYKSAERLMNGNFDDPTNFRIIQRYVLGVFYYSTNGEFWLNKELWMDAIHECNWYGITCYDNETVIGIDLPHNNLTGSLPFEIGELSSLQDLSLPNNLLNKNIPIEVANLYRLHTLDVENNTLSSTIPTMLRTLEELTILNIGNNRISGEIPAEIWHLYKLISLDLSNNTLTGSLSPEIHKPLRLKRLDVSKNFLHGSIDEMKFQLLSGLTHLDLSVNAFTGTLHDSISKFDKLQMLNLAQNTFKGSLPSGVGDLMELQTLLLHDNELTGSVPTEIGKLEKIVNISLSYNLFRGAIPKELGNLQSLKLLLLHQNHLAGDSNIFENGQLKKYVTDCGSILDSPAAVTCPSCTECCNSEGNCLSVSNTWPKLMKTGYFEKNMKGKAGFSVMIVLASVFAGVFAAAFILMKMLQLIGKNLPEFEHPEKDLFANDSVYRFLLSKNITGWLIALTTIVLQASVLLVFLNASDFTADSNEWEYSVNCPKDSLDCEDTKTRNDYGWLLMVTVVGAFLLKDLADASMLFYESIAGFNIQGVFASLTVMFITVLTIQTSIVVNYAVALSNAQLLKDAVVLLFLSDIDEALYSAIRVISPEWTKKIEVDCMKYSNDRGISNEELSETLRKTQQDSLKLKTEYEEVFANIKNELRVATDERSKMALEITESRTHFDETRKKIEKKIQSECIAMETEFKEELRKVKNEREAMKSEMKHLNSIVNGLTEKFKNMGV